MQEENIFTSSITRRIGAFLLDAFFVYILRAFFIYLSLTFWLAPVSIEFFKKYQLLFQKIDFRLVTNVEVLFFLKSNFFIHICFFILGMFLISILYNFICLSSKLSATIGQKICGIFVINGKNENLNKKQALLRSILVMLPWIFSFLVLSYIKISTYNVFTPLPKTTIIIFFILFLSWYDFIFLSKNKLLFHDLLSKTRVVIKNYENYTEKESIYTALFPDFKDLYSQLKIFTKNKIIEIKKMKEEYKQKKINKKNKIC